jgi:hypothetical protein
MQGSELESTEQLLHRMQVKHFAGHDGIIQQLDRLADSIGGQGPNYARANRALDVFLECLGNMREGQQ